jgi:hypothetical protein
VYLPETLPLNHNLLKILSIGDRRRPICRRCEVKGLSCRPARRKPIFRHGSTANLDANFNQDQTWVNSRPRNWRLSARSSALSGLQPSSAVSGSSPQPEGPLPDLGQNSSDRTHNPDPPNYEAFDPEGHGNYAQNEAFGQFPARNEVTGLTGVSPLSLTTFPTPPTILQQRDASFNTQVSPNSRFHQKGQAGSHVILHGDIIESDHHSPSSHGSLGNVTVDVQESCLLRYFIEELSPWVCQAFPFLAS